MGAGEILSLAGAVVSFFSSILIEESIKKDVNETLGTDYRGIWSMDGNKIWHEHEQLFPASRKGIALIATLVGSFGLFAVTGWL